MIESDVEMAEKNIKSLISTTMMNLLKKQKFSGAQVLVNKLSLNKDAVKVKQTIV